MTARNISRSKQRPTPAATDGVSPLLTGRRSIAHEELMRLPILRHRGPIELPATDTDLQAAAAQWRREKVVGLDTETRPTFRKGEAYPPSLVQVAAADRVYLVRLQRLDCAAALTELLENPQVVKAGIALGRDLAELQQLFSFTPANVVDLGEIARRQGIAQTGARNLAGLFLHGRVTKGPRTSNWARTELTRAQIDYAATDAWVCRALYGRFSELGWIRNGQ